MFGFHFLDRMKLIPAGNAGILTKVFPNNICGENACVREWIQVGIVEISLPGRRYGGGQMKESCLEGLFGKILRYSITSLMQIYTLFIK